MKTLNKSKTSLFLKIGIITLVMVMLTTMGFFSQKASASILGELADSNSTVSKEYKTDSDSRDNRLCMTAEQSKEYKNEYKPDPDFRASMRWKSADGWKSEPNTDPNEYYVYEKGEKEVKERIRVYDMKVNDEKFCYGLGGGEGDIFYSFEKIPKDGNYVVTVAMDVMVTKTNEKGIIKSYGLYDAHLSSSSPVIEKGASIDCRFRENNFKKGNEGILNEAIKAKIGLGDSDSSYTYEIYVDRLTITVEDKPGCWVTKTNEKTNEKGIMESYGLYGTELSSLAQIDKKETSADYKFRVKDFRRVRDFREAIKDF